MILILIERPAGSAFNAWQQLYHQSDAENDRDQYSELIHAKGLSAEKEDYFLKKNISTSALSRSPLKSYKRSEGIETPSSHGRD